MIQQMERRERQQQTEREKRQTIHAIMKGKKERKKERKTDRKEERDTTTDRERKDKNTCNNEQIERKRDGQKGQRVSSFSQQLYLILRTSYHILILLY